VILFLAADPVGSGAHALDHECAAIERELRMTPRRNDLEVRAKWAVTVDELMRHLLLLQPAVIHFCGHGDAGGVVLVGDDDQPRSIAPEAMKQMIATTANATRLVVLNACYSDAQAEALCDAVGCTIGVAGPVRDDAARAFAVGLYRALGHGRTVRNAYEQAQAALAGKGLASGAGPRCLVRAGVDIEALDVLQVGEPGPHAAHASGASYDLFIAYPSHNKAAARILYDLLQPDIRVFLDDLSLRPGDRWDHEIATAQRASRVTVILISKHAATAWYLGDEIVSAIELHRAAPAAHRLVPVLLEAGVSLPYGLHHVQAINAASGGGLDLVGAAAALRELALRLRRA
jgi:hypothetical protein